MFAQFDHVLQFPNVIRHLEHPHVKIYGIEFNTQNDSFLDYIVCNSVVKRGVLRKEFLQKLFYQKVWIILNISIYITIFSYLI